MLDVTAESLRVSRGPVLWVVAGKTKDWCYQPGPEGLLYRWWAQGGDCHLMRPCYWHRHGIAGSGGKQWYRADVESVLCFKRPGPLGWADPLANGHPPKFPPGGRMTHRDKSGSRTLAIRDYKPPALANPGNLLEVKVGGGALGHPLAHENEAPYPIGVPGFFIRSHCPAGGTVLDPFGGSGSTSHAAELEGRDSISLDLRASQSRLARKRLGLDARREDLPGQTNFLGTIPENSEIAI
jgi:hypothetical protein